MVRLWRRMRTEGRTRSTRGGGRQSLFEPSPMQQFNTFQYTALRNQIWRYNPSYQELSSSTFIATPRDISRIEEYLRYLENGTVPSGGVYGLFAGNQCMYTGRASNFNQREAQWSYLRPELKFSPIFRTDHPLQQRGMEQRYRDVLNPPLNIRNPVGPRNQSIREIMNSIRGFQIK